MTRIIAPSHHRTIAPLILAHRGARKYAPENTIPAFQKAIELKVDGVEFDVMSTSDGIPVVVHDDNLNSLTGKHIYVHKTPYRELKNIDIGGSFNPYFVDEKIPTLKEVLEVLSGGSKPLLINVELKEQARQHKDFLQLSSEIIKKSPLQIIVSSFSIGLLRKFRKLAPALPRALLLKPKPFYFLQAMFFASILRVRGINPHTSILSRRLVRYARRRKLKVITWTANTPEQISKAINLGVDAIITDEPLLVREMIDGR